MNNLTKAISITLLALTPLASHAVTATTYLSVSTATRAKLLTNVIEFAYKVDMLRNFCPPKPLDLLDLVNRVDYTIRAVPALGSMDIMYAIPMILESHYPCDSV